MLTVMRAFTLSRCNDNH